MDEVKKDGTADALTIILMGILILFSFFFVLPPLLLFGGLIAAVATGNSNFIKTSTRFVQLLCVIAVLGFGGWGVIEYSAAEQAKANVPANPALNPDYSLGAFDLSLKYGSQDADRIMREGNEAYARYSSAISKVDEHVMKSREGGLIAFGALLAAILLNYKWLKPLLRQFDNIRASFQRKKSKPDEEKSTPIIARDALTSYSVADELIKWKSLKEEGVIDEAEFIKIRDKLMQKD